MFVILKISLSFFNLLFIELDVRLTNSVPLSSGDLYMRNNGI
jgi:hypothetical protein